MIRTSRLFNLVLVGVVLLSVLFFFHAWSEDEDAAALPTVKQPSEYDAKVFPDEVKPKPSEKVPAWKQAVLDGMAPARPASASASTATFSSAGNSTSSLQTKPAGTLPSHHAAPATFSAPPLIPHPDGSKITPTYDRVLVMGKMMAEDTEWVRVKLSDWQHAVYMVDNPSSNHMHTLVNKGREALPYLTYLVEHYDNLPATVVFIHADQKSVTQGWHNEGRDRDMVYMLRTLNFNTIQQKGFTNLRCETSPGCPNRIQPSRGNSTVERAMAGAWKELFGRTKVPETIGAPCCGQFAVSRAQVLKRPLADYKKYLNWLLRTPLDDDTVRGVFEYLWHVIFGQEPVYCPETRQCYCDLYGQCSDPPEFGSITDGD